MEMAMGTGGGGGGGVPSTPLPSARRLKPQNSVPLVTMYPAVLMRSKTSITRATVKLTNLLKNKPASWTIVIQKNLLTF